MGHGGSVDTEMDLLLPHHVMDITSSHYSIGKDRQREGTTTVITTLMAPLYQ
jgi:hypothetical protein